MKIKRRKTRSVRIGQVCIGSGHPIAIQSMAKCKTSDIPSVVKQAVSLKQCGCDIIRVAVKDEKDALAIKQIKSQINLPLVADIHFDFRLALRAMEAGVDKIRLNPGNIYKVEQIHSIIAAAKDKGIPIRIGVNSGSLEKRFQRMPLAEAMPKSALGYARIFEKKKFYNLVISLKAASPRETVEAYVKLASLCDYPLHLGVTATGTSFNGAVKSSVAIGHLLFLGIGDTIRISLTDNPQQEARAGVAILEALGLGKGGIEVISCPTCGRCEVDVVNIVKGLENKLLTIGHRPLARSAKVAVMGCVVNGPGEAKEADIGIAFGKKEGLLFKNGHPVRKIPAAQCKEELLKEIIKLVSS